MKRAGVQVMKAMKEAAAKKAMKTTAKVVSKPEPKTLKTGKQRGILRSGMKLMKVMKTAQATALKKVKDQGQAAAAEKIYCSKLANALKKELGKDRGLDEVTGTTAKTSNEKPVAAPDEEEEAGN